MDTHNHQHSTKSVEPPAPDGRAMTHRDDLADPADIDHQAMTDAEHAAMGHGAHAEHDKHAGHSVEMFRSRFWITLLLSIPVVLYSPMVQEWLRF
jgi:Cu2+-exporting ATPase